MIVRMCDTLYIYIIMLLVGSGVPVIRGYITIRPCMLMFFQCIPASPRSRNSQLDFCPVSCCQLHRLNASKNCSARPRHLTKLFSALLRCRRCSFEIGTFELRRVCWHKAGITNAGILNWTWSSLSRGASSFTKPLEQNWMAELSATAASEVPDNCAKLQRSGHHWEPHQCSWT